MMDLLTSLLRFGLFGGENPIAVLPKPLSQEEWRDLFDLSREQAVTALLYDSLLRLPSEQHPPRSVLFHFTSMTQTIESDNRHREEALVHFASLMSKELSIPAVVVKGTSLSRLYPVPAHRECGDNDLYTGTNTERVNGLVESRGIAVERKDPRHSSFVFEKVTFECHNYLLYPSYGDSKSSFRDFSEQWNIVPMNGDGTIMRLVVEEAAFFLAKHMEHHAVFFHEPVRLRDLVDWCMLISSKEFDYARLNVIKKETDIDVFADLLTSYCCELFGLTAPCSVSALKDKGLAPSDFNSLFMQCLERHHLALVRVVRRSWKYLRYWRRYKALYGQSMFKRFYVKNLRVALRQHI